ncbi:MAG: HD domain-containing protein [Oscillospiraceae bacterium]|nr:HD domain-containing protein [Oscillospiraceae bacterium]
MNFSKVGNTSKVEGFALVKRCEVKVSTKGGKYLDLILADKTGEISAKYWDYDEKETPVFEVNELVKVRGEITEFRGAEQLRIELIRNTLVQDNVNIEDYIKSVEYKSSDMFAKIIETVSAFKDDDLKNLVLKIYGERQEQLLNFPAAVRLHHAVRGGLLYHTLSIITMAEKACEIYPMIDRELLITGAALHDVAKTVEMNANEMGIATDYTVDGNLIGHLVRGAMIVRAAGESLGIDDEKIRLVEHMLLSHHGKPEFGSPVRPMFLEAVVLNLLDELDAKVYEVSDVLSDIDAGTFSQRQWALDDVRLYNHGRTDGIAPKAQIL